MRVALRFEFKKQVPFFITLEYYYHFTFLLIFLSVPAYLEKAFATFAYIFTRAAMQQKNRQKDRTQTPPPLLMPFPLPPLTSTMRRTTKFAGKTLSFTALHCLSPFFFLCSLLSLFFFALLLFFCQKQENSCSTIRFQWLCCS